MNNDILSFMLFLCNDYNYDDFEELKKITTKEMEDVYFYSLIELIKFTRNLESYEEFIVNYNNILNTLSYEQKIVINDIMANLVKKICENNKENENEITR